jgi:ParB-like chromosome segregation protein Spo0J
MSKATIEYTSQERQPVIDEGMRDLLPPLSEEALQALTEDILKNGCYSPMICMEDMTLVDGHNRYAICEEHGIPYRMAVLEFEDMLAAKQWALDTQKARRNLSAWELGQIALKLRPEMEARAKERQGTRTDLLENSPKSSATINTRKELAESAGVSDNTMGRIMRLEESAPAPIRQALDKGDITVNKAYNLLKIMKDRDLPEDEKDAYAEELLLADQEYEAGCKKVDQRYKVAMQFTNALEKIGDLEVTEENVWSWVEYAGIISSVLDGAIIQVRECAEKMGCFLDIMENVIKTSNWRNMGNGQQEEHAPTGADPFERGGGDTEYPAEGSVDQYEPAGLDPEEAWGEGA